MDLRGRTAIVTGASQGIGEAVARTFAAAGAQLLLTELDDGAMPVAEAICERWPASHAIATVTDVTDPAACSALVEQATNTFGRLDVLAHATAVGQRPVPTAELDPAVWDRLMAVNAKGAFLLARAATPVLTRPGGSIVFTGSFTGQLGQAGRAAYSASKGALRMLTHSLALELAADGIRVNGVAPAYVESALGTQSLQATAHDRGITVEQAQHDRDRGIPMQRQAEAREVADAFLYLASPSSSYITGTWIDVNGGALLR